MVGIMRRNLVGKWCFLLALAAWVFLAGCGGAANEPQSSGPQVQMQVEVGMDNARSGPSK
jgi:hypothetical protein